MNKLESACYLAEADEAPFDKLHEECGVFGIYRADSANKSVVAETYHALYALQHTLFSGRSPLFTFPHPDGNGHPAGFGSFMMHGAGKAYRTHGLHSNHTRARLVDLPGRMGA